MNNNGKRQLNYELLRVVSMLMIVCMHYLSKGGALAEPGKELLTGNEYLAWFIEAFCIVAVNVYILISGYFGISAKFSINKPLKIWKQVLFYSIFLGIVAMLLGIQKFNIYQCLTYVFPTLTEHYWFATAYIVLSLLMPFLNTGVHNLEKPVFEKVLLAMILIFSAGKTVLPVHLPWDKLGYDAFWFVCLYLTGAYIRLYIKPKLDKNKKAYVIKSKIIYVGCSMLTFTSMLIIRQLYLQRGILGDFISYAYSYNHLFTYVGAIGLFISFYDLFDKSCEESINKRQREKIINTLAGSSFGVYLIHEHINFRYLWPKWFKCEIYAQESVGVFILHLITSVIIIYLVCTAIELIRKKIFRG